MTTPFTHEDSPAAPTSFDTAGAGQLYNLAILLARQGRSDRATHVLQMALNAGECSAVEALIFQGKIYVREGRHRDAELCWTEALKLDPGNVSARAALERLRRARLPGWYIPRVVQVLGLMIVLAVAVGYGAKQLSHFRQAQADSELNIQLLAQANEALARAVKDRSDASERHQAEFQQMLSKAQMASTLQSEKFEARHLRDRDAMEAQRQQDLAAIVVAIKSSADAEAKESTSQLAKIQALVDGAFKTNRDQQAVDNKFILSRMERSFTDLTNESHLSIDALDQRVDRQLSVIQGKIMSLRKELGRIIWFRLPELKEVQRPQPPAKGLQIPPAAVATTQPSSKTQPTAAK